MPRPRPAVCRTPDAVRVPARRRPVPRLTNGLRQRLPRVVATLTVLGLLSGLVLAAGPATPPATAATPAPPLRLGLAYGDDLVWASDARLASSLNHAVSLGVDWVRADLSWADIQWDGRDVYLWPRFDRVVAAARARDLRVLPVLAYTPPWARRAGCPTQSCPPADPAAFAAFAGQAVARYAPQGLHVWEVWNEPNHAGFWSPEPSATDYARLLASTVPAIRRADPRATVVLGGLAALRDDGTHLSAPTYLDQLGRAGALGHVDALGYHPYTYPYAASFDAPWRTSWNLIDSTSPAGLRAVLARYGRPDLPIWLTEYGAPTGGPGTVSDGSTASISPSTTHVTEARQARLAIDALRTAAATPHLQALVWYSERDRRPDASSNENFYGLRRWDGSRKPAFSALRWAVGQVRASRPPG